VLADLNGFLSTKMLIILEFFSKKVPVRLLGTRFTDVISYFQVYGTNSKKVLFFHSTQQKISVEDVNTV
jgi:hypothetical protein